VMARFAQHRRTALFFVLPLTTTVFSWLFLSLTVRAEYGDSWIRFLVNAEQFQNRPGVPFAIAVTRYRDYTLSATAWYRYIQGGDPVVLHGKKESQGLFRPILNYEVAMEDKTKWKRLPAEEQANSDSITVSPENPIARLEMTMEPFRSCIGIYRYGRVLLENGDAAIIGMEDLLPTADARGKTGDFREDVFGGDLRMRQQGFKDPEPTNPAHLSSVTSLGGRLIGDFIFVPRSEKPVILDGTKTIDGDFWPKVTFQVGNDDQRWETIGKSQRDGVSASLEIPSGKGETVRVVLTDYKPFIGKYKYGRVTFSNGESGVFYLELLDPKSS
jgi:hypothetical protein